MRVSTATGAVTLALGAVVATAPPAAADPATSERGDRERSVRPLPCAPDEGYFLVDVTYHSTSRTAPRGGHATQNGAFTATPVDVTRWADVSEDDHDHEVPVEWQPRAGSDYTGRVTASTTAQESGTGTFTVTIHGWGSAGERFAMHYLAHQTATPRDATWAAFDRGRCG